MTSANAQKTDGPSPRVLRRQERTRQSILDAATERFAEKGVATVSVEEIIEAADVSRGTFYKMFKHKEDVLSEILQPLMENYGARLAAIDSTDPLVILDQVFDVYIQIWREAPIAFSLSQRESLGYFHRIEEAHRPVMAHMRRLFKLMASHGIFRAEKAEDAIAILARSAVIILRVFDQQPDWERLFRASMRGLLLTDEQINNNKFSRGNKS